MEAYVPFIVVAILAYFIGSISFAVILSRKMAGFDVREKGSKGAGATNVLRTVGKKAAILTLTFDALKGVGAVLIAMLIGKFFSVEGTEAMLLKFLAGLFAIIGHTFPIFFEFRGGKGVATAIGILLILEPKIALMCITFGIVLIAITKMVSVGSVTTAILFPILMIFLASEVGVGSLVVSILISLLVIFNHRKNIKRIKDGTENKLNFKKTEK